MMGAQRDSKEESTDVHSKKLSLDGDELLDVNEVTREIDLYSEDHSEVVAYLRRQLELSKYDIERFKSSDDIFFLHAQFFQTMLL